MLIFLVDLHPLAQLEACMITGITTLINNQFSAIDKGLLSVCKTSQCP